MLKVSSPQPPMDMNLQMPMQDMGNMEEPSNENQPPMDFEPQGQLMDNDFDTNFDAGVDADEEIDPKRYIQQLTGKLSQTLRSYNENLPQPDADLNKFVAGMINKQAIEGLNQNDIDDILKKIKSDEPIEDNENNVTDSDTAQQSFDENMPMESVNRKIQIDEIFNDLINQNDEEQNISNRTINKNNSFKRKPFTSPNFQ